MNTGSNPFNNFFAGFYELWGGNSLGKFSDVLYKYNVYAELGYWLLGIAAVLAFAYYAYNSPSFKHWYHWGLVLLVGLLLDGFIAYRTVDNLFLTLGIPSNQNGELMQFIVWNGVLFFVAYFLFSLVRKIKPISNRITSTKNTPF